LSRRHEPGGPRSRPRARHRRGPDRAGRAATPSRSRGAPRSFRPTPPRARALVGVIAILTFLAALCAGAAELVATHSTQWRSSIAREATIQVKPAAQRSLDADVARAVELARTSPGVASVKRCPRPNRSACSNPGSAPGSTSATFRCRG
jgi:cell division transport system permease protein